MQNSTENNKKISLEKMNQAIFEQTDQVLASPISEIRKKPRLTQGNKDHWF